MNMKQVKYMIVLAEEGSFSKAAEALRISQPSLSQYIKKIEKQLGVDLFDRTNGAVRLTDAGKAYLETGKKMLELEHQLQNELMDIAAHKSGSIIVGTTPFRSAAMMPVAVAKFRQMYPGIHVVVDERETSELRDAAEKGVFDLCVITGPVDERIFDYELIMDEEMVIAVPTGSKLDKKLTHSAIEDENKRHKCIDVKMLDGESFVMVTETQVMQRTLRNMCLDNGIYLKTAAIVKSLEAQLEMVREGVGAALIPTGIKKFGGTDGKISYFSLMVDLPKRVVVAMYRKGKVLSAVETEFVRIMKNMEQR